MVNAISFGRFRKTLAIIQQFITTGLLCQNGNHPRSGRNQFNIIMNRKRKWGKGPWQLMTSDSSRIKIRILVTNNPYNFLENILKHIKSCIIYKRFFAFIQLKTFELSAVSLQPSMDKYVSNFYSSKAERSKNCIELHFLF